MKCESALPFLLFLSCLCLGSEGVTLTDPDCSSPTVPTRNVVTSPDRVEGSFKQCASIAGNSTVITETSFGVHLPGLLTGNRTRYHISSPEGCFQDAPVIVAVEFETLTLSFASLNPLNELYARFRLRLKGHQARALHPNGTQILSARYPECSMAPINATMDFFNCSTNPQEQDLSMYEKTNTTDYLCYVPTPSDFFNEVIEECKLACWERRIEGDVTLNNTECKVPSYDTPTRVNYVTEHNLFGPQGTDRAVYQECSRPQDWCQRGNYSYVDCDGDGILDHTCHDGSTGEHGTIRSRHKCLDTWPNAMTGVLTSECGFPFGRPTEGFKGQQLGSAIYSYDPCVACNECESKGELMLDTITSSFDISARRPIVTLGQASLTSKLDEPLLYDDVAIQFQGVVGYCDAVDNIAGFDPYKHENFTAILGDKSSLLCQKNTGSCKYTDAPTDSQEVPTLTVQCYETVDGVETSVPCGPGTSMTAAMLLDWINVTCTDSGDYVSSGNLFCNVVTHPAKFNNRFMELGCPNTLRLGIILQVISPTPYHAKQDHESIELGQLSFLPQDVVCQGCIGKSVHTPVTTWTWDDFLNTGYSRPVFESMKRDQEKAFPRFSGLARSLTFITTMAYNNTGTVVDMNDPTTLFATLKTVTHQGFGSYSNPNGFPAPPSDSVIKNGTQLYVNAPGVPGEPILNTFPLLGHEGLVYFCGSKPEAETDGFQFWEDYRFGYYSSVFDRWISAAQDSGMDSPATVQTTTTTICLVPLIAKPLSIADYKEWPCESVPTGNRIYSQTVVTNASRTTDTGSSYYTVKLQHVTAQRYQSLFPGAKVGPFTRSVTIEVSAHPLPSALTLDGCPSYTVGLVALVGANLKYGSLDPDLAKTFRAEDSLKSLHISPELRFDDVVDATIQFMPYKDYLDDVEANMTGTWSAPLDVGAITNYNQIVKFSITIDHPYAPPHTSSVVTITKPPIRLKLGSTEFGCSGIACWHCSSSICPSGAENAVMDIAPWIVGGSVAMDVSLQYQDSPFHMAPFNRFHIHMHLDGDIAATWSSYTPNSRAPNPNLADAYVAIISPRSTIDHTSWKGFSFHGTLIGEEWILESRIGTVFRSDVQNAALAPTNVDQIDTRRIPPFTEDEVCCVCSSCLARTESDPLCESTTDASSEGSPTSPYNHLEDPGCGLAHYCDTTTLLSCPVPRSSLVNEFTAVVFAMEAMFSFPYAIEAPSEYSYGAWQETDGEMVRRQLYKTLAIGYTEQWRVQIMTTASALRTITVKVTMDTVKEAFSVWQILNTIKFHPDMGGGKGADPYSREVASPRSEPPPTYYAPDELLPPNATYCGSGVPCFILDSTVGTQGVWILPVKLEFEKDIAWWTTVHFGNAKAYMLQQLEIPITDQWRVQFLRSGVGVSDNGHVRMEGNVIFSNEASAIAAVNKVNAIDFHDLLGDHTTTCTESSIAFEQIPIADTYYKWYNEPNNSSMITVYDGPELLFTNNQTISPASRPTLSLAMIFIPAMVVGLAQCLWDHP